MIQDKEILFKETQRFTQWWLWLILGGISAFQLYGCIRQVFLGLSFGNNPISNAALIGLNIFLLIILFFFWQIRLETVITKDRLYIKFFPFHFKFRFFPFSSISKAYVRKYSPLQEYGGWGLRYGFGGKAYNIKGNMGLQIDFKDSSNLLIGTQKAQELEAVLRRLGV
jgi:hypothetical protein